MHDYLINHSALGYLNQWHKTDRPFMASFQKEADPIVLAVQIKKLATKYQVVRNFPTAHVKKKDGQEAVDRLWIRAAKAVSAVTIEKRSSPAQEVHALADKLGAIFPPEEDSAKSEATLLSAASKFLWFAGHTSVRIYDKRAVDALNALQKERVGANRASGWRVNGDYDAFARAWRQEYKEFESKIVDAGHRLPAQIEWSIIPEGKARKEALLVVDKPWFRDRIFDKFLWTIGALGKGGADIFE